MSGVAHVAAYLKALEDFLPPPRGRHYTLEFAEFGNDVAGFERTLCLRVGQAEPIYLDQGDLEKPVEQLLQETIDILHRADEVKRRLAEFDQATGGA